MLADFMFLVGGLPKVAERKRVTPNDLPCNPYYLREQ